MASATRKVTGVLLLMCALLVAGAMADSGWDISSFGNSNSNNNGGDKVVTVDPEGGESFEDLSSYELSCPDEAIMTAVSVSLAKATFKASESDPDPATTGKAGLEVTKDIIEGFGPVWCGIPSKILPKTVPTRTTPAAVSRGFVSSDGFSGIIMRAGFLIDALTFTKPAGEALTTVKEGTRFGDGGSLIIRSQSQGSNPRRADSAAELAGGTGGRAKTVQCPKGYVISGLFGKARKDNVVTVGLRCKRAERWRH